MIAASALVTDNEAKPQVVERVVQQALAKAGCERAEEVLLFLTPEFSRIAAACVTAASRSAQCLQIFGGIAAGVAHEAAWAFDRPAAVALVLADLPTQQIKTPLLSYCGRPHLPSEWCNDLPRFGLVYADSLSEKETPIWQGARLHTEHRASLLLPGLKTDIGVSTGVILQGPFLPVDIVIDYELRQVAGEEALHSLKAALPAWMLEVNHLPLHFISVAVQRHTLPTDPPHLVPIISINGNRSLTLAEKLQPKDTIAWALRCPDTTEADMKKCVKNLATCCAQPAFGAFFSCIGRGPFFYAGEDRDWRAFRKTFPDMPFIGAYGSGQIFPSSTGNLLLQNSVISVLFSSL